MSLIRSFIHPFIQLSHSETNKCVTCQQFIISPFNLNRLLCPFAFSCLVLPVFFLYSMAKHPLACQSFTPVFGPVVIPCSTMSSWSRTGDLKSLWFVRLWNKGLCGAWISVSLPVFLSVCLAYVGKETKSLEVPVKDQ